MNKLLLTALIALTTASAFALLPEDEAHLRGEREAVKRMHSEVQNLHRRIAEKNEAIAKREAAAAVREVESQKAPRGEEMMQHEAEAM